MIFTFIWFCLFLLFLFLSFYSFSFQVFSFSGWFFIIFYLIQFNLILNSYTQDWIFCMTNSNVKQSKRIEFCCLNHWIWMRWTEMKMEETWNRRWRWRRWKKKDLKKGMMIGMKMKMIELRNKDDEGHFKLKEERFYFFFVSIFNWM